MSVNRFDANAVAPTPWKNGGGTTREIASFPPGSGIDAFDWRVSIASIESNGPFSSFKGIDRIITLLDGDGVRLHSKADAIDHRLDVPLVPFAFSGEASIDCTLLGGASTDFNVMTRRGINQAQLDIVSRPKNLASNRQGLLFAARGSWTANDEPLLEGQGLWWVDEERSWSVSCSAPDAKMIAVFWTPSWIAR